MLYSEITTALAAYRGSYDRKHFLAKKCVWKLLIPRHEACHLFKQLRSKSLAFAPYTKEMKVMLWTVLMVLLVLWLLGLVGGIGGSLIHALLLIAGIVLVIQLLSGRRTVV